MIAADVAAGAPTNADLPTGQAGGTLHLVHYAAWLVRKRLEARD
jgi:hypothetical protein